MDVVVIDVLAQHRLQVATPEDQHPVKYFARHGTVFDPIVSAAKYFVAEQVRFVLDQAFRVLGGHAYYGDLNFGRYLRDFVGLVAAAGTQDVLEVNLGVAAVTRLRRRAEATTHQIGVAI